jgi:hypothetical protein
MSTTTIGAEEMRWEGTLEPDLAAFPPLRFEGSGVATLASAGAALQSLRIGGGIAGSGTIPITDPDASATFASIRITASLGTGTLSPFSPFAPWPEPQLQRNALPIRGNLRVCMFTANCTNGIVSPLSEPEGEQALGVGGLLTVGGFGNLRVSIQAAPWTVYSATLPVVTTQGGTTVWQRTGWIHGPASFSSSAATTGGALQLVTPLVLRSNDGLYLPGFTSLTLRFIPEPGALVSVAAGIIGLACLHGAAKHRSRSNEGKPDETNDLRAPPRRPKPRDD